ncbi:MAG: hypothetical protein AB7O24_16400 [Kofleriaceae bacterium]
MMTIDVSDSLGRRLLRIAIMVAIVVAGSIGYAHAERNEIAVGPSLRALRSDSANAISDQDLVGPTVSYARELGVNVVPGLELWAAGSFGFGAVDGVMFQSMTTRARQLAFTVGGRARYELRRWLAATARVDVGTARTSLEIDAMQRTAADHGWGAISATAIGGELVVRVPRSSKLTIGLRLELGYVAATAVELTPSVDDGDMTIQLPTAASSFGSLSLSGPSFDIVVFSRF